MASPWQAVRTFWDDGVFLIRHPGTASFVQVAERASLPTVAAGSAVGGFVGGLLFDLLLIEIAAIALVVAGMFGFRAEAIDPTALIIIVMSGSFLLVIAPLGGLINGVFNVFVMSGFLYGSAYVLGGRGSFTVLTYLLGALFTAATVISTAMMLVPVAGWIAAAVFSFYLTVPLTNCLSAVYRFTTGRAVLVWLGPLLLYLLLVLLAALPMLAIGLLTPPEAGML